MRVGVVGVGHLGRHHARLYAASPRAHLVGVVDADADRAAAIAAEHGTQVFPTVAALAAEVEAASVAVPTAAHAEVAVALLDRGVHVLVEKPLAASLEDADRILDAAGRAERQVMVGHSERFNPAVRALTPEVQRPRFFEIHRLAAFTARSTDIDVVLDLMIHDLDLLLHFDPSGVASVDAVGVAALTNKADIANARIRMESGCVANLTASRMSAEGLRRIRVFQRRTYLSCDTGARRVERYALTADPSGRPTVAHDLLPVDDGEPLGLELDAFLGALQRGEVPPVDGAGARRVLDVAYQVKASIAADSPDL